MARPKTTKTAVRNAPGIRKIVRDYGTHKVTKYEARVNDVHGGRGLISLGTFDGFDAAKRALTKARRDLDGNSFVPPSAGKALFGSVAQDWLASAEVVALKARTREGYRALIAGRLAPLHDVPVGQLRYKRLSQFLADLTADGLSPASVRNVLAVLRAVLDEAVRQELLPANPARSLTPPRPRRTKRQGLEISEVEELIQALPERWSLLVETAAYTGLRAGELAGLKVEQLDLRRRLLRVTRTVVDVKGELLEDTPKTEAGHRTVTGLSMALCARLAAYVAAQGLGPADYVFGADGQPYRHNSFYRYVFRPTLGRLGLAHANFHDLRKFHTTLVAPYLSPKALQDRMGHASVTTTLAVYAGRFKDDDSTLAAAIDKLRDTHDGKVIEFPQAG